MKSPTRREFWIEEHKESSEDVGDNLFGYALKEHPRQGPLLWQSNLIHVREVLPTDDAVESAVEGMREALVNCLSDSERQNDSEIDDMIAQALAAFDNARGLAKGET